MKAAANPAAATTEKAGIGRFFDPMKLALLGFDLRSWLLTLRRHGGRMSPAKIPLACLITLSSIAVSLLKIVENIVYGARIRTTPVHESPLFILGHWRTGTTLLHELLCRDDRFTFPTSFTCFNPHCFILTERVLKSCIKYLMPSRRPQDNMATGPDNPQEDEFALTLMGAATPYGAHLFPSRIGENPASCDPAALSQAEGARWERAFLHFLKKITVRRNRPIVLKSPPHTFRVSVLLRMFPQARFVYLVRNPLEVFPSTIHTFEKFTKTFSLQDRDIPQLDEYVFDMFIRMHAAFERDRGMIPRGRLYVMRYEDLAADPEAELEKLYAALDLGGFEQLRSGIQAYARETAGYKKNKFAIEPELRKRIALRWAPYIKKYGYDSQSAPPEDEPAEISA